MKTRTVLYADEGMVLTNGEIYGKQIFLAAGDDGSSYYEITQEDYETLLQAEQREERNDSVSP